MSQTHDDFNSYEEDSNDSTRGGKKTHTTRRRPTHARQGARPAVHNGIHRRRNKRFSWYGCGRRLSIDMCGSRRSLI